MNGLLALLAVVGLVIFAIGRWMVSYEARSISLWWVYAIRFLPLADVMFLARYWELARTGTFTALTGLVLTLPWGAQYLWARTHAPAPKPGALMKQLGDDDRSRIIVTLQRELGEALVRKSNLLQQLNARMTPWYQSMQTRRAALRTPEEIAAFNEEAAAYATLRGITKEEAAEVTRLQGVQLAAWSDVTEEMVKNYFAAHAPKDPRYAPGATTGF